MLVQIASDLHSEFRDWAREHDPALTRVLPITDAPVLVLAGDVGNSFTSLPFLRAVCHVRPDTRVLHVPGNHEFYGSSIPETLDNLRQLEVDVPNYTLMHDRVVEIDGLRFVGSTLWFSDGPDNQEQEKRMYDFKAIRDLKPGVYEANVAAMRFLSDEVPRSDVVITHHVPIVEGIHPRWRKHSNTFFLCAVANLMADLGRAKLWVYGHTHDRMDFMHQRCRFTCNPLGYPTEKTGFEIPLLMEVPRDNPLRSPTT